RFRFGLACSKGRSRKEFTELARKAEALGYSTLFVPDHFVEHDLAPTIALAHAAAVTDDLRVGTFVLGNDYKHPVVCAREMASLDLLSDGRLELGIGAGWMTADYEKAGIPLDRPGVRIARLAESITVMKGLFAPGPFTFHGEYYNVSELDGMPKPVQQPVPFFVGGGAPKILALAAREAQIVGINANLRSGVDSAPDVAQSMTPAATDQKVGWVRDAAGARYDDLELQSLVGFVHVTDDAKGILGGIADAFGVSVDDARLAPPCLVGSEDEIVASLEERRERWQMSYHVIEDGAIDAFAPIVERLAGK
ncbi:MAG TPA: TIGR03621 family F420-dependent LLM class oxidoreductase, partial [Acidimicrobiia bacterium]|nr:TIGR03621 family F420-dependent LLM class oxidoreductase [Acidimicrobiia bacterium]